MVFKFNGKPIPKKVYVYTDGSYRDGVYAGAYLVFQGTTCIHTGSGCGTKASCMNNVAGELSAVMHAAQWLKKNNCVGTIVYDYTGIYEWISGGWRAKNEFTKAYRDFMLPFYQEGIVEFKWVKGHNGDLGNTMADKLAREALNKRKAWS